MPGFTFLPDLNAPIFAPDWSDFAPEPEGPRALAQDWAEALIERMQTIFAAAPADLPKAEPEAILRLLLHHEFNYQSRGKTAHLAPDLLQIFAKVIDQNLPLPMFLLYHGGYRTKVGTHLAHTFAPDLTELMLLWQVARLKSRLDQIHAPGLRFCIVINNGVAAHTNGIPITLTDGYVSALRRLIARLGAQESIWVLNQSELGDFSARMAGVRVLPMAQISTADHGIVERFLGRRCSVQEAGEKLATYAQAETVWGAQVRDIVAKADGFFCRQIAHPACLSFRPFPGGAIRVQNGSVTLQIAGGQISLGFVTPLTWDRAPPLPLPLRLSIFEDHQAQTAQRRLA